VAQYPLSSHDPLPAPFQRENYASPWQILQTDTLVQSELTPRYRRPQKVEGPDVIEGPEAGTFVVGLGDVANI
jgi:hypothetical protein